MRSRKARATAFAVRIDAVAAVDAAEHVGTGHPAVSYVSANAEAHANAVDADSAQSRWENVCTEY